MTELILTDEQKEIVALDVPKGQLLKISAFAGTAKTTTLRLFAEAHPDKKFLYLAYNSSVAAEGKTMFPSNTKCQTTHSMAFGKTGYPYKGYIGNLKPYVLTDHLGIKEYGVGKYLIDVLVKYLASADDEISEKHLVLNKDQNEDEYVLEKDPKKIQFLLKKANQLWEKMQDVDNKKIPMMHDGYLKLYQLSKPQLDYDYILLDEAHDTNGVTLDIFLNQNAAKIIVGDSHQCQPKGTKVKLEGNQEKDISEMLVGDKVITYRNRQSYFIGCRNQGRKVTKVGSRHFEGNLYKITTHTNNSFCTNNHKWLVKFSNCKNCYMVYLMQHGSKFRTGVCKAFYKSGNGLSVRCRHEKADKGWILKICDSFKDALLEEQFVSCEFGISQQVFQERSTGLIVISQKSIDDFYNRLTNMETKAKRCLEYFGRDLEYPIYTKQNGLQRGGCRPFVVEACNLISGKMKIPTFHDSKIPIWEDIKIDQQFFKGEVYSLDVEGDHNYISNNMLTHNSCYGFRWAYNAMEQVEGDIHKYLSNSFRFNDKIAIVANLILNKVKKENKRLNGMGKDGQVGFIDTSNPYSVVARTNAALFDEAADLLNSRKLFGFVGTSDKDGFNPFRHYYFDRILDVYYLYIDRKQSIKDKYIKRFKDFDHFTAIINDKDAPDMELKSRAIVVTKHKHRIPLLIDSICQNSIDPKKAHIVFTTAHRSKGLEFDQVRLTHDFAEVVIENKDKTKRLATYEDVDEQEINLLYIAATRAKKVLQMNKSILNLVKYVRENK